MVSGHLVSLAAFLVQPDPPALALGMVVFDIHCHGRAYAGETIRHESDERAIAQTDNELRVFAARSRRRNFVGRTLEFVSVSPAMEISPEAS